VEDAGGAGAGGSSIPHHFFHSWGRKEKRQFSN